MPACRIVQRGSRETSAWHRKPVARFAIHAVVLVAGLEPASLPRTQRESCKAVAAFGRICESIITVQCGDRSWIDAGK